MDQYKPKRWQCNVPPAIIFWKIELHLHPAASYNPSTSMPALLAMQHRIGSNQTWSMISNTFSTAVEKSY